ncbi:MAG TPA: hypothetical protein VFB79_09990 [Candidatus Angelobacter sp.]|nr:hypothetical protein [Candidatus Angelobacter sp.]
MKALILRGCFRLDAYPLDAFSLARSALLRAGLRCKEGIFKISFYSFASLTPRLKSRAESRSATQKRQLFA